MVLLPHRPDVAPDGTSNLSYRSALYAPVSRQSAHGASHRSFICWKLLLGTFWL